jgi:hypothetical protein
MLIPFYLLLMFVCNYYLEPQSTVSAAGYSPSFVRDGFSLYHCFVTGPYYSASPIGSRAPVCGEGYERNLLNGFYF